MEIFIHLLLGYLELLALTGIACLCAKLYFNRKYGHELWYQNRATHKVEVMGGYDSWLKCSRCGMTEGDLDKNICSRGQQSDAYAPKGH